MLPPEQTARWRARYSKARIRDECGIVGVHGHPEAANMAYLGLYALQHRGQESAGICTVYAKRQYAHRGMGLVADVFDEKRIRALPGRHAIGHVRYSTSGESRLENAQPFCADIRARAPRQGEGFVAIAHNGNLVNAAALRRELESAGAIFSTTSDSEVIVHLVARSQEKKLEERLIDALSRVKGAYSLVVQSSDALIAVRDPHGFRPLVMGRLDGAYVLASETCALDLVGASDYRRLEPGEMVVLRAGRLNSLHPFAKVEREAFCIFEYIYFARPDSNLDGGNVYNYRKALGRMLAQEHPAEADIVVPLLDSGSVAALGYADQSGIPYEAAIIRNHFVGRTFIEPAQSIRDFGVKVKHNAIPGALQGKRVVLVDDSIVRGTSIRKISNMLRGAGALEVHVRISAPPTVLPCHYGIDMPTRDELIAAGSDVEAIRRAIQVESLGYLSLAAMREVSAKLGHGYCDACFSGEYPVSLSTAPPNAQLPFPGFRAAGEPEGEAPAAGEGEGEGEAPPG